MAIGDAYKPTASKKPAPEPERYVGHVHAIYCRNCGGEISGSYVVRGDQRFHANEPACRKAWAASGGGGVLAEVSEPASRMTGPDRGALERARAETPEEAAALDRAGVMSPDARAAVLARQPAPKPTPSETVKAEAPSLETASGSSLDALGASAGVRRFIPVPGDGEPETDAAYRARIARTIAGRIDRTLGASLGIPKPPPPAPPIEALRVYVAGASKEPDRCRGAMAMVEKLGGSITLDWLEAIALEGAANEGLDDDKRKRYARADFEGVETADLVWLLASPLATTGSWTELGIALGLRRFGWSGLIVVSGPARERSIFASLADFETDHDLEALDYIRTAARHKREGLGG